MGAFDASNLFDPFFGHLVCGLIGRNILIFGRRKNLEQIVVNSPGHFESAIAAVSFQFHINIHESPGVDDVIGGIKNIFLNQHITVMWLLELVIGAAGDDLKFKLGNGGIINDGP